MGPKNNSRYLSLKRHENKPQSLPVVYNELPEEGDEGGLDLSKVLAAIRRRVLIIVGVTTAVTAVAAIAALNSDTTYRSKFELLTEPVTVENKLVSSLPESLNSQEDLQLVNGIDKTELRVLQSPKLMTPILKEIRDKYPDSTLPDLKLNPIPETNILEVSYEDPDPEKLQYVLDLVAQAYLKYSLEERRSDIRQGIEFVEEQLPQLQQRVEILQNRLQTFRQQYDLIDPEGQGKQLSTRLDQVVQQRVDNRTQLSSMRSLHDALKAQLDLEPDEAVTALALSEGPRYQSLLDKLQEVETKIALESSRYRQDSPTIQALREQRENLQVLVDKEAKNVLGKAVTSQTGSLTSPNGLRNQQTQQFFEAAQQIQALEAQDKALAEAEAVLRQQVKQFPMLARQNDDLERKLKIAVDNLNQFLSKREALRIDAAQTQVPWQLLAAPTPPQASVASLKQNIILGIVLGLLLGIGVALAVDKLNNVFYSSKEVKNRTKLRILGEIPFMYAPDKVIELAGIAGLLQKLGPSLRFGKRKHWLQTNNVSQFWEALRSLYTNIRFLNFDTSVRSLAIISATAEDGRSTIALHLAQTAAAMGQRVLLVDADLRRPKIHTMLELSNTRGLSNLIVEDVSFERIIHKLCIVSKPYQADEVNELEISYIEESPAENNFFVLTAGQTPPNPTTLLSSARMQELVKQFSKDFDLVIYDTSPLFGIADGNLLATYTEASLLVVRLGKTNCHILETVLEELKISATPILGVVANGAKKHSDPLVGL